MAFITYDATSGTFPVQIAFQTDRDYVIYNNTKCPLNIEIPSAEDGGNSFILGPGEANIYHADTDTSDAAGTSPDVVGTPVHTAVNAGQTIDLEPWDNGVARTNEGQARLVVSEF